jgi:hypothetical protein
MMFVLILGLLIGGAAVVLFQQWRSAALVPALPRRLLPGATPREPAVAKGGGLFFMPASRRRRAA